ncbi:hypothetical protein TrVGV298_008391 [Trichoderma virens]|nr:hypothetical protein TrVGV298_008391 [Trichoderma virens]
MPRAVVPRHGMRSSGRGGARKETPRERERDRAREECGKHGGSADDSKHQATAAPKTTVFTERWADEPGERRCRDGAESAWPAWPAWLAYLHEAVTEGSVKQGWGSDGLVRAGPGHVLKRHQCRERRFGPQQLIFPSCFVVCRRLAYGRIEQELEQAKSYQSGWDAQ